MRNNMLAIAIALFLSSWSRTHVALGLSPAESDGIPTQGRGNAAEKRRAAKMRRQKREKCRKARKK